MRRRPFVAGTLVFSLAVLATLVSFDATRLLHAAPPATESAAPVEAPAPLTKEQRVLGGGPQDVQLTPEEQQFVDDVNQERTARGLTALTVAPLLVNVAREKSQEMHDLNYWGHVSPIEAKRTALRRVMFYLPQQPKDMTIGENLYYCNKVLVKEGHEALMKSPTHRRNILNPVYKYIGVGTYTAPNGEFWTTQIFGDVHF